ncbi:MAG: putative metal-binding motif-containing protein [Deltaproteobacteria bacterium]|nr:putative metal-binding motif-containing protein [Deltaproteobacteria bacterium]
MHLTRLSTTRSSILCILALGFASLDSGCYLWHPDGPCEGRDGDLDGWTDCDDCDDADPAVYPGAGDGVCCGPFDGKDNDCDGEVDEDGMCDMECRADFDGDGWFAPEDCDDTDPSVNPGAPDMRDPCFGGDGIDQDCDGTADDEVPGPAGGAPLECDVDGDGWFAPEDCDDYDPTIHPGADDVGMACGWVGDGVDQDCDGVADDQELDVDWCPTCERDFGGVCVDVTLDACNNPCPDQSFVQPGECDRSQVCCVAAPLETPCEDFDAECVPDGGCPRGEVVEQADCGGGICCKVCDGA